MNILKNVTLDEFKEIRLNMINNILATDNKEHFINLKKFENEFKDFPTPINIGKRFSTLNFPLFSVYISYLDI